MVSGHSRCSTILPAEMMEPYRPARPFAMPGATAAFGGANGLGVVFEIAP
jgi:hypothetical protein